jgi:hypothetical protein
MLEKLTERQMLVLKNVAGGYRTNESAASSESAKAIRTI